jgi:phage FluMu protein Com
MELRCKHCNRYLGEAHGTIVATIKCSNSKCVEGKAGVHFKYITTDRQKDMSYKFIKQEAKAE